MKIYVAGKITGLDNFREIFEKAVKKLKKNGHNVMNPAALPGGFEYEEYMKICFAMIDACEAVYFLDNWQDGPGAIREHKYASSQNKILMFEVDPTDTCVMCGKYVSEGTQTCYCCIQEVLKKEG